MTFAHICSSLRSQPCLRTALQVQEQLAKYSLPLHLRLQSMNANEPSPDGRYRDLKPLPLSFGALTPNLTANAESDNAELTASALVNEIIEAAIMKAAMDAADPVRTPSVSTAETAQQSPPDELSELAREGVRICINGDNGVVWKVTKTDVAVAYDDKTWEAMAHTIFSNRVHTASVVCPPLMCSLPRACCVRPFMCSLPRACCVRLRVSLP